VHQERFRRCFDAFANWLTIDSVQLLLFL